MNILLWTFFLKGIVCFEKMGWMEELSSSVESWGYKHLEQESAPEFSVDDIRLRAFVLREGRMPRRNTKDSKNNSLDFEEENKLFKKRLPIEEQQLFTGHRRLVEEILESYDPTVHPRRDFRESTRVNLSMSLYQILEVDERKQSIVVNVWMVCRGIYLKISIFLKVQNWFDEVFPWFSFKKHFFLQKFLDWDPNKFEMINKTIVPYQQIWVPDTVFF
ncbi:unnamed protein product [Meloidogyne enterolobii]|uniref:Uncharacterized protein n=1 Tax=Meloidogyne enterolobii TaxID=390850 RepID=A0ACB1AXK5_MELEN